MAKRERVRIVARGAVQGVGFRPFVYRLARELELCGWVSNSPTGVFIEAEGEPAAARRFLARLPKEKPSRAIIHHLESAFLDSIGYRSFEIRPSEEGGAKTAFILPDIATCQECLREIFDPEDRRFRYPFTNCTNCGPRFSIIEALPYDRANTSMKRFEMCPKCAGEYQDPADRRFHAQPNACPACGPQLELLDADGELISRRDEALHGAAAAILQGKILALKGIGGFHLMVDAREEAAVVRLRQRKHREEKPFALMLPSLEAARNFGAIGELEESLLLSPEGPIVLVRSQAVHTSLATTIAPDNPYLAMMLPYSPLHHLLMRELNFPIVATSGNRTDEPICVEEKEAVTRLRGIADTFLVHDRPIVRHGDDSIVRIMCGRELVLRRARGYAPLPITLRRRNMNQRQQSILALGAHLKNTVALSVGPDVFISQHIGDLSTREAHDSFLRAAADLPRLYDAQPDIIAHDLHPDYLSTAHARDSGHDQSAAARLRSPVQHHFAHLAACMAENEIDPPVLGVAWDGTGFGPDGTIWGGEFLLVRDSGFERVAHFRPFRLPGGEAAIKEPRRSALGLLHELLGEGIWQCQELLPSFSADERRLLRQMLEKQFNVPLTSSVGRLFDAVAALIGLRDRASFEGQAAMELEFACAAEIKASYAFGLDKRRPMVVDWAPAMREMIDDLGKSEAPEVISAKFHNMLVRAIVAVAQETGEPRIVLSGGCFQNRCLTEGAIQQLRAANFQPYWHQRIPPNDGGISLGQIAATVWQGAAAPP